MHDLAKLWEFGVWPHLRLMTCFELACFLIQPHDKKSHESQMRLNSKFPEFGQIMHMNLYVLNKKCIYFTNTLLSYIQWK